MRRKGQISSTAITLVTVIVILITGGIVVGEFTNSMPNTEAVINETHNATTNEALALNTPNAGCDYGLASVDGVWNGTGTSSPNELATSAYNADLTSCQLNITAANMSKYDQSASYTEYMYGQKTRGIKNNVTGTGFSAMNLLVVGLIIMAASAILAIIWKFTGR